jgi:SAM-dependent methyltransferase
MATVALRKDLVREAEMARELEPSRPRLRALESAAGAEELGLSSSVVYAYVLFALWDSGFYEYVREHPRFHPARAVDELGYDPMTFEWLLYYLVGRGVLRAAQDGEVELTEKGRRATNTLARGLLNLYVGGYGALLSKLGPLLRREIRLDDPSLDRSVPHAAAGTEDMTCVRVVPSVIDVLREHDVRGVLDLGCGTGGFLVQWARLTGGWGVGVDMSPSAVAAARVGADLQGLGDRLRFVVGEVGNGRLPIDDNLVQRLDAVTAMFFLHELGRDGGDAGVAHALSELGSQFPGKLLIVLEMIPVDVGALNGRPPPAMDALDYHFIHPLSRQGAPRPKHVWEQLYREAEMQLLAVRRPRHTPLLVHVVRVGGA